MLWGQVAESRPAEPTTVRVFVRVDYYYNYAYRDEEKWLCLRVGGRDLETLCYAYIDRSAADPLVMSTFQV